MSTSGTSPRRSSDSSPRATPSMSTSFEIRTGRSPRLSSPRSRRAHLASRWRGQHVSPAEGHVPMKEPAMTSAADHSPRSPEPVDHAAAIERFFAAIAAGDYEALHDVLAPDAITRWPQSGELITGALACVHVYQNY